jgi:predicted DNA-binding WGR domain protein
MREWWIKLEAICAARRCFRAYEIAVGTDLFGTWIVEMSYGRIGTTGRSKIRSFPHVDDARAQVRSCLKRRATAPQRIGVGYQMRGLEGSMAWVSSEQEEGFPAKRQPESARRPTPGKGIT